MDWAKEGFSATIKTVFILNWKAALTSNLYTDNKKTHAKTVRNLSYEVWQLKKRLALFYNLGSSCTITAENVIIFRGRRDVLPALYSPSIYD